MPQKDELEGQDRELKALYDEIIDSPAFRLFPRRSALFSYLWKHRYEDSPPDKIWHEALEERATYVKDGPSASRVRDRCRDLRGALEDYSAEIRKGWRFYFPDAIRTVGYRLRWIKVNDPNSATSAFWRAHLDSAADISIVYIEQLFYQDWWERLTFRYYDCNEEHSREALAELKHRHQEAYNDRIKAAYPFVAWGEVEARDLITRWFAEHAMLKVKPVVTRRIKDDSSIWQDSLILLGAGPGNHMISDLEKYYPDLPIRMPEVGLESSPRRCGRVTIQRPTRDEMRSFARFNPVRVQSGCTLDFHPDQGTLLAYLTRVPNPHTDNHVTVIHADFGRAIEQIAALLTDEGRMRTGKELPPDLPDSFQVLFSIPISDLTTDHRHVRLELLTWRPYPAKGN